jgi:hypothetical protein
MAELEADIDACEFRAIDCMRGRGGGHQNFDVCVRGGLSGGSSKRGGASLLGAVSLYDVLPYPLKFSSGGGVC